MRNVSNPSRLRSSVDPPRRLIAALILTFGVVPPLVRYVLIHLEVRRPHPDVRIVWHSVAEAVLSGTPLYLRPAIDNKPPLFELLNIAVYATGAYMLVFLGLVGLANAGIAFVLWRLLSEWDHERLGVGAAFVFLGSAPLVNGLMVNVRSFSMVLLLLAFLRRDPVLRGAAAAGACLISQYALLPSLLIVYDGLQTTPRGERYSWVIRFGGATAGTIGATFGVVYLIWGWPSVLGGLKWSISIASRYALEWGPSILNNTDSWLELLLHAHVRLLPILLFAAVGVVTTAHRGLRSRTWSPDTLVLHLMLLSSLPLLVRPFYSYWLYPLPWISVLATLGWRTSVGYLQERVAVVNPRMGRS